MNEIADRIKYALNYRKLKPKDLSEKTGISRSSISEWLSGKYEPKQDKIFLIAEALNVDEGWLLGLDVPIERKSNISEIYNQLDQKRQQKVYSFAEKQLNEQNKIVDYPIKYDVNIYGKMTAGHGSINFDKEHPIKTVTLDYAPPGYDIAFEVSGDSMHPAFQDGEVIFVKETQNIHDGMLAAVEINDEAFIKKLYIEENRIRLVSLNCEKDKNGNRLYPDFYADEKDAIHMIGQVLT